MQVRSLYGTSSLSKTAAGVAATSFLVKYGTNGSVADTTEVTFTGPAETAAVDTAQVTIILTVRSVNSSTGTWSGNFQLVHNDANATGFVGTATSGSTVLTSTTGSFNDTVAGGIVGLAVTTGTSDAFTFQQVQVNAFNL